MNRAAPLAFVAALCGCDRSATAPPSSATAPATVVAPSSADATAFSGRAAHSILRELVEHQRYYGAPRRDAAIKYLSEQLRRHTDTVELQRFSATEPGSKVQYELVNIIARQRPAATVRYWLGSHWDSRLWAENDPDPARREQPGPYANDSGSGVAILLELARHTASLPSLGIDYILFDGEEFGRPGSQDYCQGSKHLARTLADGSAGLERPAAVIVLDMVGDRDLTIYYEVSSLRAAPELARALWQTAAAMGIREFRSAPRHHIVDDHTPFQRLDIPAILLIDYDYPYYHTHADTLDKVSVTSLDRVGRVLWRFLQERDAAASR